MATNYTSQVAEELVVGTPAGESKSWNWHPDIPVQYSPLFTFPPNPLEIIKWLARAWLPLTELTCYLLLAVIVWNFIQPPLAETRTLAAVWVGDIWVRNLIMMTVLTTALHLWLYRWHGQGDRYRYLRTSPTAEGKRYLGGYQLLDNIVWTLASGVTVWTMYEIVLWLSYSNGIAPMISFSENPVWFMLWFPLIGIWYSFHFYWVHRFLHWKPMYDRFHSVHHRNITVGPWSGLSMHPVEHLLYMSSLLVHLVVPSHPVHMLFHLYWLTLATATSHSGYEALVVPKGRTVIASFFHQLHHRYFICNYGNVELPMDRWFGSFNDGTSEATRRLLRKGRETPGQRKAHAN